MCIRDRCETGEVFESNGRRLTETDLEPDDCIENRVFSGHSTMVESDYDLAIEDTDRIHGRTALVNNVRLLHL